MAKNVELMGAVFPDCPAVMLPTHEGPLARFTDVSDSQAVAADVAQGKAFYLADGTKTTGTNQGGGGGGGGGGTIKPNARLVLIDYDGSIVDSYTQSEINALSALPANPDHSGDEIPLTSQGWNWTLTEIREQLAAMPEQVVYVGQMYIPTDGKTHIVIYIPPDTPESRRTMTVRFTQSVSRGVAVNWGDATPEETYTGTTEANHDHTYAGTGWFDITLEVMSGNIRFVGSSSTNMFGQTSGELHAIKKLRVKSLRFGAGLATNAIYTRALEESDNLETVTIPNMALTIGARCFYSCDQLKSITFPRGVDVSAANIFYQALGLESVSIPAGVTSIGGSLFYGCNSLEKVTIPKTVTTIGANAFSAVYHIKHLIIPAGVTSIGTNAFSQMRGLNKVTIQNGVTIIPQQAFMTSPLLQTVELPESITTIDTQAFKSSPVIMNITIPKNVTSIAASAYMGVQAASVHLKPTTPPTLANSNAFSSVASDCVFYVPYSDDHSILAAYQAATNWSTYASRMVEEAE